MTIKFSQFLSGGEMRVNDQVAGLRSGNNYRFDFPGTGIKDSTGAYLLKWLPGAGTPVNYVQFQSASSTNPALISAVGGDDNINLSIGAKGTGHAFFAGTGAFGVPVGTTAQQPAGFSGGLRYNTTTDYLEYWDIGANDWVDIINGAALADATYITKTDETADLPNSQPLSAQISGFLHSTTATGVITNRIMATASVSRIVIANDSGEVGNPTWDLAVTAVTPGAYTAANITVDAYGRITLAANGGGGFVTSVSGTANRITSTGGTTPVIDIAATYVGQTSITTLGTIATGVWQGTAIGAIYGGTGQTTYTLGDTLYASAANTLSKLVGNTTTAKMFLSQTGTGAVSAAPVWETIDGGDITGAALTRTDDTNVTITLGGTPTTALLQATSLTMGWTGVLSLARGGTNANLTASNGGIFYSTATAGAILAGTATGNQMLQSGATAAPAWSTATWPATTTVSQILYSSATNTVAGLATANSAVLVTSVTGVPAFSATMTNGQVILGSTGATPAAATLGSGAGLTWVAGAASLSIGLSTTGACNYRLSLTTGLPVTTADVTGATTVYAVPYGGKDVDLYSGSRWFRFQPGQLSITTAGLSVTTMYDVVMDYNGGTPSLGLRGWTNATTRATALAYQDGVLVLSGEPTLRYLGTIYTDGSTQFNDSLLLRHLWSYYHRVEKAMVRRETTNQWTYTTATYRQANAAAANQLSFIIGVSEDAVTAKVTSTAGNALANFANGIGLNSTSVNSATMSTSPSQQASTASLESVYNGYPAVGLNLLVWLEISQAAGTTTWQGQNTLGSCEAQSGIEGNIWC